MASQVKLARPDGDGDGQTGRVRGGAIDGLAGGATAGDMIHVCSLAALAAEIERVRPAHVISIVDPDYELRAPPGVDRSRHLTLRFHDIDVPLPGYSPPEADHIERLIAFGRACGDDGPLLIHCHAGVSRSSAAALIVICLGNEGREERCARVLREHGRHVSPNRRMVDLADALLGRGGRLIAALRAMEPPTPTLYPQPIAVPTKL